MSDPASRRGDGDGSPAHPGFRRGAAAALLGAAALAQPVGALAHGELVAATERSVSGQNRMNAPLVELLREGQAIFGIFSGDHTAQQGAAMAGNPELDFVFYSLERGPFDIPQMREYMVGLAEGADGAPHPLVLRVPPIGDDAEGASVRVQEALAAGVVGIVFPHVRTAAEAATAVEVMGDELWPGNADGRLVNMLIIEDREGIENASEIVATPGVSVVFAGPGDLSRAYERDMDAVETAIQTVLSACNEHGVPCGITAGTDDIETRLQQGFRAIIVTQPEALPIGQRAAGRMQ